MKGEEGGWLLTVTLGYSGLPSLGLTLQNQETKVHGGGGKLKVARTRDWVAGVKGDFLNRQAGKIYVGLCGFKRVYVGFL